MNNRSSKSGLFLVELIAAILFFAVACAVCTQLFVRAHLTSQRSGDLTHGVIAAQNAAECFKASPDDPEAVALLLGGRYQTESGEIEVSYGRDWQALEQGSSGDEKYRMTVYLKAEPFLETAAITVWATDSPKEALYTLTAKKARDIPQQ
ncbi:hypothetical protein U6B65_08860 [Oscillospiraceae bacterium MB08-C2-2]|nr:hypothetical protein U6B65_08860 [Oscillospiraceae bacterium MB08-C2-2]